MGLFGAIPAPQDPPEKPQKAAETKEGPPEDRETRLLLSWRMDCLMRGGFNSEDALLLAREEVDYRLANNLLTVSKDPTWVINMLV